MIDTRTVQNRRVVRFNSVDDLFADVDRIVAAAQAGKLHAVGNWTAGQAMGHVASWATYPYDGFPMGKAPWFIRIILRLMKNKYLRQGMPAGVKIPKVENGTFGLDAFSTEDAAARLKTAFTRLQRREPAKFDSPAWGKMTPDELVAINLRHAELHLSFLTS